MIANIIDPELRDDISVTLKVVGPNRDQLEITIDQQRPPCAERKTENVVERAFRHRLVHHVPCHNGTYRFLPDNRQRAVHASGI